MPTFIDETGDPGAKETSTRYFLLSAVWFEGTQQIEAFTERISALKTKLGLPGQFEFHFARISKIQRIAFFNDIRDIDFRFAVSGFDKGSTDRRTLTKREIQERTVEGLAQCLHDCYLAAEGRKEGTLALNEKIVYDECRDLDYVKLLKTHFRALPSGRGGNKKLVTDIRPRNSTGEPCLQLADMICGATIRRIGGDPSYDNLIGRKKIGELLM